MPRKFSNRDKSIANAVDQDEASSSKAPFSDAEDARVSRALSELHDLLATSIERIEQANETVKTVTEAREKIRGEKKSSSQSKSKLQTQYQTLMSETNDECESIRDCLNKIAEIKELRNERRIAAKLSAASSGSSEREKQRTMPMRRGALMMLLQQGANTLPLFIGYSDDRNAAIPPLCGALPADEDYVCRPGHMVAAHVETANQDGSDDTWILAEVIAFNRHSQLYDIDDIDEEQKERHRLRRDKLIPLPLFRANPETEPELLFPVASVVLALYPQTTCFYRGLIERQPTHAQDVYYVKFEDSSYPNGYSAGLAVPQKYVVASPN